MTRACEARSLSFCQASFSTRPQLQPFSNLNLLSASDLNLALFLLHTSNRFSLSTIQNTTVMSGIFPKLLGQTTMTSCAADAGQEAQVTIGTSPSSRTRVVFTKSVRIQDLGSALLIPIRPSSMTSRHLDPANRCSQPRVCIQSYHCREHYLDRREGKGLCRCVVPEKSCRTSPESLRYRPF